MDRPNRYNMTGDNDQIQSLLQPVEDLVQRYPLQSVGVGLGVGYLLAHRNGLKTLLLGLGAGFVASQIKRQQQ